jgi:hypothetical protein
MASRITIPVTASLLRKNLFITNCPGESTLTRLSSLSEYSSSAAAAASFTSAETVVVVFIGTSSGSVVVVVIGVSLFSFGVPEQAM